MIVAYPTLRVRQYEVIESDKTDHCYTKLTIIRGVSNRASSVQFSSFGAQIECTSANDHEGI